MTGTQEITDAAKHGWTITRPPAAPEPATCPEPAPKPTAAPATEPAPRTRCLFCDNPLSAGQTLCESCRDRIRGAPAQAEPAPAACPAPEPTPEPAPAATCPGPVPAPDTGDACPAPATEPAQEPVVIIDSYRGEERVSKVRDIVLHGVRRGDLRENVFDEVISYNRDMFEPKYDTSELTSTFTNAYEEAVVEVTRAGTLDGGYRLTLNIDPDNFMRLYMEYASSLSDAYPEFHHAGALFLLSLIADRKAGIRMQHAYIFPNTWMFCLGASTISRKSTAIREVAQWARECRGDRALPSDFSPQGLIEEMDERPRCYLIKDEAAQLLSVMAAPYMAGMRDLFLHMYECDDYRRKLRTGKRNEKTEFTIRDPYLSMLWATTQDSFSEYTTTLDLTSGWLPRFLFYNPAYRKESRPFQEFCPTTRARAMIVRQRIEALKRFFDASTGVEFRLSRSALEAFQDFQMSKEQELMNGASDVELAFFGRYIGYILKLAMLLKIGDANFIRDATESESQADNRIEIEERFVNEAIREINRYFLPVSVEVAKRVELKQSTNLQNKILALLRQRGGTMKRVDLMRALHLRKRDLEESIEALEMSEELHIVERRPVEGKKPELWLVLLNQNAT